MNLFAPLPMGFFFAFKLHRMLQSNAKDQRGATVRGSSWWVHKTGVKSRGFSLDKSALAGTTPTAMEAAE
jgi:hypothetical protein